MNQDIHTSHAVVAEGLGKRYGELVGAPRPRSRGADGTVLGLLGHNGAGKTTGSGSSPRSPPRPSGSAVAGFDVPRSDRGPRPDRADQPGGDRRRAASGPTTS